MNWWKTEPAVLIGVVGTIVVLVAQQALTNGLISSTGSVNFANFLISVIPLVMGVLTRSQVSPAR